jgi:nuclear pore complex protein Nup133
LIGAGGTHGELCVRFPLEDLREPIIKDNLLDDEILQENLEKNRLDEWFKAACRAGKNAYMAEKRGERRGSAQEESGEEELSPEADTLAFEGDTVNGTDQDQDVEMQDP